MGRKKIQISRITDERNRQVNRDFTYFCINKQMQTKKGIRQTKKKKNENERERESRESFFLSQSVRAIEKRSSLHVRTF